MVSGEKTVISGGSVIRTLLSGSREVTALCSRIFPVASDNEETLPYIVYRRAGLDPTPVKSGRPADTALFEVWVYASTYAGSLEIAEAVRTALDGFSGECAGLCVRYLAMTDAAEDAVAAGDAMVQQLTFEMKA